MINTDEEKFCTLPSFSSYVTYSSRCTKKNEGEEDRYVGIRHVRRQN